MIRTAIIMLLAAGCGAAEEDVRTAESIIRISAPIAAAVCHAAGGDATVCDAIREIACVPGPTPKCALTTGEHDAP